MATRKEIREAYENRGKVGNTSLVAFSKDGRTEAFSKIKWIKRDGKRLKFIDLDWGFHVYEFESIYEGYDKDLNLKTYCTHHKFYGKVVDVKTESVI